MHNSAPTKLIHPVPTFLSWQRPLTYKKSLTRALFFTGDVTGSLWQLNIERRRALEAILAASADIDRLEHNLAASHFNGEQLLQGRKLELMLFLAFSIPCVPVFGRFCASVVKTLITGTKEISTVYPAEWAPDSHRSWGRWRWLGRGVAPCPNYTVTGAKLLFNNFPYGHWIWATFFSVGVTNYININCFLLVILTLYIFPLYLRTCHKIRGRSINLFQDATDLHEYRYH